jgi:hypothetical protein
MHRIVFSSQRLTGSTYYIRTNQGQASAPEATGLMTRIRQRCAFALQGWDAHRFHYTIFLQISVG